MCLELIATIYHVLILDTGFFVCFLENSLVFMYYSKKFTLCINTTCLVVTKYYSGDSSSSSTWIYANAINVRTCVDFTSKQLRI